MTQKKSSLHKAFSLIELSIVILIIGILVAGVTQGSRLVNAYKLSTARTITQSAPVTSIKNLVIWLDATAESSITNQNGSTDIENGDTVKSWKDISQTTIDKRSISQATTAYQPAYITNAINNLPSVRFTATNDNSRLTGSIIGGVNLESTIFFVFKWNSSNALSTSLFSVLANGTVAPDTENAISTGGAFTFYVWNGASNLDTLSYTLTSGTSLIMDRYYNPTANSSTLYVNGTSVSTSTASVSGTYGTVSLDGVLCIGNHSAAARTFGGDIGEFIMFDRALKSEERKAVEQYLGKKWGIKVS